MSAKNVRRTWGGVLSLVLPLVVVGASAMAISYATLIDVARVNGMPLPELFPILIDVGTVACMVAAAQFRTLGINGRWLAHVTFFALSGISVFANATHALGAADLTATTLGVAIMLAATPPAALVAITHLVMKLVPDMKERERIAAASATSDPARHDATVKSSRRDTSRRDTASTSVTTATGQASQSVDVATTEKGDDDSVAHAASRETATTRQAGPGTPAPVSHASTGSWSVDARIRESLERGATPSGREVADWLGGKSTRTGQRYLAAYLERENAA
ncbi:hypothetical protein [Agromyces mariniharenae]|uniref:DUF2637 domain-containing protein n=1 Tax=Agromyces mariniharenae TaxID=2604423 RepID=A0A5S4V1L8_9MICO|nr:hypothetical protein [Agromyces mariniharenae]TYL50410.1 hypothetical protein FYC51_14480 [Agromyces mariniharenae]